MNLPNPAAQAQAQETNPWKVLALVFGGILVYEGVSYYWNRERGRYARRNPAKTFRIVENGVYLGTFAGETYDQARFSASQYYWTNEYATLAEKAREVEAKRARKNPRRAPSEHSAYAAFEMQEARAWAKTEEGKAHYEKLDRDMREFERRQRALSPAARRAQAKANRKAQEETDRKFKALPVLPVQSSSSLPWWPSR